MKTENIVIVGGGSSGWMTATTLLSQFPNKKITLIESPNIATVGVGESTIASINRWLHLVGIKDTDFLTHVDGTIKLSIQFENFYRKDSGKFHYPFGNPFVEGNVADLNDWHFKKMLYPETPVSDYAECHYPQMALVSQNKLCKNEDGRLPNFNFLKDAAYQFDATKFGLWLKDYYCLPKGLNHILSEVKEITQNENGIEHLILDDGRKISADLFIDCTGFTSLLMDKTFLEPFDSYSDILPNNSAWTTKIPYKNKSREMVSYTNCSAIDNGWVWSIPLWSRMGSGYVYSDEFIMDDDALIEFQNHIGYGDELDYKNLKMRIGIHNRLWVKNVIAIGLSAGFIEPLESTGLQLTHDSLFRLVRVLQRETSNQFDRDQFSAIGKADFREIAEFVSLHFALSQRDDTEYWRHWMNKTVAPELINQYYTPAVNGFTKAVVDVHRINHYRGTGGLHCIGTGMHWWPTDRPSLTYNYIDFDQLESCTTRLTERKDVWKKSVKACRTPYMFLKENFYND